MNRRQFFGFGVGVFALSALPINVLAEDYRKAKPNAWSAENPTKKDAEGKIVVDGENLDGVNKALKDLYGIGLNDIKSSKDVKLKVAATLNKPARSQIKFGSKIGAKSIALLQSGNPESLVAVYDITPYDMMDYEVFIKMGGSGTIFVVVQGQDGKFYKSEKKVTASAGGCEG